MKLTRMQALASACCLMVPMMVVGQSSPADPTSPAMTSPMASPATPGTTNTQTTPGMSRPNTNPASTYTSESSAGGAESDAQMMKDKMFLTKASEGGMAEVQLGQLASDKASSPKVKAFGQKMVTDHTMLNNNLKPFADKMGVPPPASLSPEDQAELDKLNGLTGADFDKEYVAYMVKDHDHDLKDFRKEAAATGDPDLKTAVENGEKVIAQHHRMIDRIAASMNVTAAPGM